MTSTDASVKTHPQLSLSALSAALPSLVVPAPVVALSRWSFIIAVALHLIVLAIAIVAVWADVRSQIILDAIYLFLILGAGLFFLAFVIELGVGVYQMRRATVLRLERLEEVRREEANLISQLSSASDAEDLAERSRFVRLHAQLTEKQAAIAGLFGLVVTSLTPLMLAWEKSGVAVEVFHTLQYYPASAALGAGLGALLMIDYSRRLARIARLYEEASLVSVDPKAARA